MKIYIVWYTDYDNNVNEHIIGIYKNKNSAIKKCKKYDNKFEGKNIRFDIDNNMLGEFDSVSEKCKYYCTMIDIDEDNKNIYFLKVTEDAGAQRYSVYHRIYVVSNMRRIMDYVEIWFDEEHNRNGNCPKCKKYNKHLKYLKYKKYIKNKKKYASYKKYEKYESMNTDSEYESESNSESNNESESESDNESVSKSNKLKSKKDIGLQKYKSYLKLHKKNKYTICKRKVIKDIYCSGNACVDYSDCEEISLNVWKMKII
ncbi:hypothetical protein CE11_01023 [Megavirus courdo11]|uniref:Uncharacterized protein n=2 Tax=Megavirus TaxID=3044761 RepID=K7YI68_9VIRU|nr:hypothetical protein c7_L1138 [Megavirus courdo7]AFX93049.1 hypothetical protein CE11_01023 [Megavirus courdo11]AVL94242.1 hypothetical protein mvi_882 [Megavirus vitis]